jgi:hypothetical protein
MGRDQRRRDAVRLVIEAEPVTPDTIQHIHSVLAVVGFFSRPARRLRVLRPYSRKNSRSSPGSR